MAFFVAVLFIFFDSLSFEGTCCSACHFDPPSRNRVTLHTLPVYTTLKVETFAGRNFRDFTNFSVVCESLYPRNRSFHVVCVSLYPRNFLEFLNN